MSFHGVVRRSFKKNNSSNLSSSHNSVINDLLLSDFFGKEICINKEYYLPFKNGVEIRRRIIIHPGGDSANKYRRWPIEKFVELGKALEANRFSVVFLLGPEEKDLCDYIEDNNLVSIQPVNIGAMLSEISKSQTVVCSDSGIGHFGAALDKAVFTIFGPADPRNSKPIGKKVFVIESKYSEGCRPCVIEGGNRGCVEQHCLKSIGLDQVLELILDKV